MENVKQYDFTTSQLTPVSYPSYFYCLKINKINSCTIGRTQNVFSMISGYITKSFENK